MVGWRLIFIKHLLYFRHSAGLDIHPCKMATITSTLRMRKLRLRVNNFLCAASKCCRWYCSIPEPTYSVTFLGTKMAVSKQASETLGVCGRLEEMRSKQHINVVSNDQRWGRDCMLMGAEALGWGFQGGCWSMGECPGSRGSPSWPVQGPTSRFLWIREQRLFQGSWAASSLKPSQLPSLVSNT